MEEKVILPETLIAKTIQNANSLADYLKENFNKLLQKKGEIRHELERRGKIINCIGTGNIKNAYVIDGAHIAEVDKASSYSISCAVAINQELDKSRYTSCSAILPHVISLPSISSGLMTMQEIMLAVDILDGDDSSYCFIDGSKISMFITINQFYSGLAQHLPKALDTWRKDVFHEPGKTITKFESKDYLTKYLLSPRIIGNLKLVTTTQLIEEEFPEMSCNFDDKTLASLVLNGGEMLAPIKYINPAKDKEYHMNELNPYAKEATDAINTITQDTFRKNRWESSPIHWRDESRNSAGKGNMC
ncbi:hypothetical protein SAMN02746089_02564 [Caldanaerobius fijiensis DSM 17918]|uniref:NurA domain-containing protein n=1 Tax=Caldanaerobius fijiensis DSM 17918 TaxID=1121256 RepID=A0A1M5EK93_9THEO|nr:hypothetical protein [Caldanaerobius fijiensis]SHF79669.1 hypothetical protein SAMN02746089_02564 [Caldanaerobius fijiensis DSM 17918]